MKQTRLLMGMPITVTIEDERSGDAIFDEVYDYFSYVDASYSPYKPNSEVSKINRGLPRGEYSREMRAIIQLCDQTKEQTNGYFDVWYEGKFDPSGLVKGWAIQGAAAILAARDFHNFSIDAGGDIQVNGHNADGHPWRIGIRNPFNTEEIVKVVAVHTQGVATSGTYIRGQHIYNPHLHGHKITEVASLTVIGPNIYEADRFATAAFAMGKAGIEFIEQLDGFEAYLIDDQKRATMTSGFEHYQHAKIKA